MRHPSSIAILSLVLSNLGCGGGGGGTGDGRGDPAAPAPARPARDAGGPIPAAGTLYELTIEGATSRAGFSRSGWLVVLPSTETLASTNGRNAREVGIISGDPVNGDNGSICFATNTAVYPHLGIELATGGAEMLDVAYVGVDEPGGTIEVTVDEQVPFWGTWNVFPMFNGYVNMPYQIVRGTLRVQFSADGETLQGTVEFLGTDQVNLAGPTYRAVFSGRRVR